MERLPSTVEEIIEIAGRRMRLNAFADCACGSHQAPALDAARPMTAGERAEVLRRSHAVADAAKAPNALARINDRAKAVWAQTLPTGHRIAGGTR